ncbi:uncharacterized protein N7498_003776 [Penicillium cinerascens]|uniref:Major facilitator superfamily (MFS) profile domain-containing protein n=1 Tax=Penicillium cinerascens TaxID=70096 RepID=A0A9W9N2V0_9EURO|nr:uncharacterized protein N7498_003776 [Penicillium cinerascens]KAJ5212130.1 hypothetical protein N7498_003776 [Penicillium cinerascens]
MAFFMIPELNTRTGTLRAYHLAAIVFISSFLSAYDSGIAGGILTYKSFEKDFRYPASTESRVSSLTVGLEQLGSFIAATCVYPITNRYGRKVCIIGSTALFVIGVIIQVINTRSLAAWYVGRIVAGLGMGGQSVVIPMYSAEMTPKEIRGRCGSFYQWLYAWGVFLAYWVNYGVSKNKSIVGTSREWQIPVGLQLISGGTLFIGAFTLPESIRWLLTQNRTEDAWKSIVWIRGGETPKTRDEFTETQLGLQAERAEREGFSIRELLEPANQCDGKQCSGCFAPQYFKLIAGSGTNRNMLLSGLFGAVKVIACTFFIWVLAERLSRRMTLVGGAALMAICMLITALIVDYIPTQSATDVTAAGRATVAMIYLDIMIYNCSWGPMPWAYVPEIFPTRIRALGLAVSMLAHWASSFCFSFASPYMITNVGANTFLIFMGFDVVAAIFCWFFVKETRGKNLEVAAGTEWEAAERSSLDDDEKGGVLSADGKKVELVSVHENFHATIHHR